MIPCCNHLLCLSVRHRDYRPDKQVRTGHSCPLTHSTCPTSLSLIISKLIKLPTGTVKLNLKKVKVRRDFSTLPTPGYSGCKCVVSGVVFLAKVHIYFLLLLLLPESSQVLLIFVAFLVVVITLSPIIRLNLVSFIYWYFWYFYCYIVYILLLIYIYYYILCTFYILYYYIW